MPSPTRHSRSTRSAGFTLIEVMITAAIVAILVAIALPSYRDYILRGQLVDATTLLSAGRANMERYFQDNRTYATVGTIVPPCDTSLAVLQRTQGKFVMTCSVGPTVAAYTLLAQGSGPVATFSYTVDQAGTQGTSIATGGPWSGASILSYACWITKKNQTC